MVKLFHTVRVAQCLMRLSYGICTDRALRLADDHVRNEVSDPVTIRARNGVKRD